MIVSRQLYFTINLEEIFYFCNKKMPYLCGLRRFANAYYIREWKGVVIENTNFQNSDRKEGIVVIRYMEETRVLLNNFMMIV